MSSLLSFSFLFTLLCYRPIRYMNQYKNNVDICILFYTIPYVNFVYCSVPLSLFFLYIVLYHFKCLYIILYHYLYCLYIALYHYHTLFVTSLPLSILFFFNVTVSYFCHQSISVTYLYHTIKLDKNNENILVCLYKSKCANEKRN